MEKNCIWIGEKAYGYDELIGIDVVKKIVGRGTTAIYEAVRNGSLKSMKYGSAKQCSRYFFVKDAVEYRNNLMGLV